MSRSNVLKRAGRILVTLLVGMVLCTAVDVAAQQPGGGYKVVDVPAALLDDTPQGKTLKMNLDRDITSVLRAETWPLDDSAVKTKFDGWFTRYYFGILTRPDHMSEWVERREDFFLRRLPQIRMARMHDYVIDLAYRTMTAIVSDNFHPAARYNAMLLAGMLNSSEAVTVGEAKQPPVPLIQALKFMLDELENPQQIDAVRVAALVGILRHVRIDRELPDGSRRLVGNNAETLIVNAMTKLLTAEEPPEGRTASGHVWMQRRAADVLGLLGSVGQGGDVVTTLQGVLANEKAPISLRCSAADALGQLDYPPNANVDAVETAKNLGIVAAVACYDEIKRVEDIQAREKADKAAASGAMMGGYGAGYGEEYGMDYGSGYGGYGEEYGMPGMFGPTAPGARKSKAGPLAYRIDLTRRRVKNQMLQVKRGLTGHEKQATGGLIALTQAGNGQEDVQKVVKGLDAIISLTDDASFDDLTALVTEIRTKVRQMEDDCGIVAEVPEDETEMAEGADVLANPLEGGLPEIPTGLPGADDIPALPGQEPAAPEPSPAPKGAPAPKGPVPPAVEPAPKAPPVAEPGVPPEIPAAPPAGPGPPAVPAPGGN